MPILDQELYLLDPLRLKDSGGLTMLSREMPQEKEICQQMPRDIEEVSMPKALLLDLILHHLDMLTMFHHQCHHLTISLDMLQHSVIMNNIVSKENRENILNIKKSNKSTKNNMRSPRSVKISERE